LIPAAEAGNFEHTSTNTPFAHPNVADRPQLIRAWRALPVGKGLLASIVFPHLSVIERFLNLGASS
jgi:hypothetical protein